MQRGQTADAARLAQQKADRQVQTTVRGQAGRGAVTLKNKQREAELKERGRLIFEARQRGEDASALERQPFIAFQPRQGAGRTEEQQRFTAALASDKQILQGIAKKVADRQGNAISPEDFKRAGSILTSLRGRGVPPDEVALWLGLKTEVFQRLMKPQ